jgi:hypothetical protein
VLPVVVFSKLSGGAQQHNIADDFAPHCGNLPSELEVEIAFPALVRGPMMFGGSLRGFESWIVGFVC